MSVGVTGTTSMRLQMNAALELQVMHRQKCDVVNMSRQRVSFRGDLARHDLSMDECQLIRPAPPS